jgi:hypothetical protein
MQILFSSLRLSQTSRRHKTIKRCKLIVTCPSLSLSLRATRLSVLLLFFPFLSVLVVSFCPYLSLSLSLYLSIYPSLYSLYFCFFSICLSLCFRTLSFLSHGCLTCLSFCSSGSVTISLLFLALSRDYIIFVCVCYSTSRLPLSVFFSFYLSICFLLYLSLLRVSHVRQY